MLKRNHTFKKIFSAGTKPAMSRKTKNKIRRNFFVCQNSRLESNSRVLSSDMIVIATQKKAEPSKKSPATRTKPTKANRRTIVRKSTHCFLQKKSRLYSNHKPNFSRADVLPLCQMRWMVD